MKVRLNVMRVLPLLFAVVILLSCCACTIVPPESVSPEPPVITDITEPAEEPTAGPEPVPQTPAKIEHEKSPDTGPVFVPLEVDYKLSDKIPHELAEHIRAQRSNVFGTITDAGRELFKSYLHQALSSGEDQRVAEIVRQCVEAGAPEVRPETLTRADAAAEIEFLYGYMKAAYGGYGYFGGDNVFGPLKADTLAELDRLADAGGNIGIEDYAGLLAGPLYEILDDAHFHIGSKWFAGDRALMYYAYSEELVFHKDGDIYKTTIDGVEYDLTSVENDHPERYIKATLLEDGTFAYVLGEAMSQAREITPLDVFLVSASGHRTESATLRLCKGGGYDSGAPAYRQYERDGIMVLENRRLYPNDSPELLHMNFAAETGQFIDKNAVIIDVRYNEGGNSAFVTQWLGKFLRVKDELSFGLMFANLRTLTAQATGEDGRAYDSDWYGPVFTGPTQKENQTVTFLLMGLNGSSGETWNQVLRETDNVVMVGTNSLGALQYANVVNFYLPYSGLFFQCGTSLSMQQLDFSPFECVGYQPDLWVDPELALDRVCRFVERYGLNNE